MAKKIDRRNCIKVVVQNDFIKAKASHNMEASAQKLLRLTIAQSKVNDKEFYEYEVSGQELAEIFGVTRQNIYQHIDKWTTQCVGTVMEFKNPNEKEFEKFPLFDECSYKGGILRMKLHKRMTPFVLGLKKEIGFTQYELSNILTIKGKYTIRIYEMIMMEMKNRKPFADNTIEVNLEIDEIRIQTSTEKRYKQIGELKKNVINKAIEEIEDAMNWKIETTDVKRGKTIVGLKLKIWSKSGYEWMNREIEVN